VRRPERAWCPSEILHFVQDRPSKSFTPLGHKREAEDEARTSEGRSPSEFCHAGAKRASPRAPNPSRPLSPVLLTEFREDGILISTVLRGLWKNFINLAYPLSCLICKAKLNPLNENCLCETCWEKIEFNLPPFCRICGKHLPAKYIPGEAEKQDQVLICIDCQRSSSFFKRVRSVCIYDGIIKECIHLFKYRAKLTLAKPLAKLMVDFARNFLNMKEIDIIVPVPLHKAKQRQRQFNQAHLLAKSLSRAFTKKLGNKQLAKIKFGPAQVNLSKAERRRNVKGAFKVKDAASLRNKNVLLVDDVLTTQATANECSKMLLQAGANRVEVFTLARSA